MSKGVQLWPGDRMRSFYRRHIAAETALDTQSAERLVEALTKATNRMLVWEIPAENPVRKPVPAAKPAKSGGGKLPKAGKNPKDPKDVVGKSGATVQPATPFDPYAFSAVVVLAKQGRDGLAQRLAEIKSVEHLKKLADAQHLGFDRSLSKIDDLRSALMTAAEQRLADRRAAAS